MINLHQIRLNSKYPPCLLQLISTMSSQFNARKHVIKKLTESATFPSKYVVDPDAKLSDKKKVQRQIINRCKVKLNDDLASNFCTIPPRHRKRISSTPNGSDDNARKSARLLQSPSPTPNAKHNTPICNTNQAIHDVMFSSAYDNESDCIEDSDEPLMHKYPTDMKAIQKCLHISRLFVYRHTKDNSRAKY